MTDNELEIARHCRAFRRLQIMAGYCENGTNRIVSFFQDETEINKGWFVRLGHPDSNWTRVYGGNTFENAVSCAWSDHELEDWEQEP